MKDFSLDELVSRGHISKRTKYNYLKDLKKLNVSLNSVNSEKKMYSEELTYSQYHLEISKNTLSRNLNNCYFK